MAVKGKGETVVGRKEAKKTVGGSGYRESSSEIRGYKSEGGGRTRSETGGTVRGHLFLYDTRGKGGANVSWGPNLKGRLTASVPLGGSRPAPGSEQGVVRVK